MRVVPVGDTSDGMSKNLNRRFWHVYIVIRRACFPQVLQYPWLFFTRYGILLWFEIREITESLKE